MPNSYIGNIFRFFNAVTDINTFNSVKSPYHQKAKQLIEDITAPFDLSNDIFPSNAALKMQWYMAECVYVCERYNRLLGQSSNAAQLHVYLLSGGLVAMCDMVIDDIDMSSERLSLFRKPKVSDHYHDDVEKLYATFYHTFLLALDEDKRPLAIDYYEKLFDAQVRSKQQFDKAISKEEVDQICKDKCGYSLLFWRALVDGPMKKNEAKAWFELGAFVQYCNDAQDLHKDLNSGIHSFASVRSNLNSIANDLEKQKCKAYEMVKRVPFEERRKDHFLFTMHVMHMAILAKLHAFTKLCNGNYSRESFRSLAKEQVRRKTTSTHFLPFAFKRALRYRYATIEQPSKAYFPS